MRRQQIHTIFIGTMLMFLCMLGYLRSAAQCTSPIAAFPYSQGFEADNGNWVVGGASPDWTWGKPNKLVITAAASGNNCWITGGLNSGNYNLGEQGWLQSPCFDFSSLKNPFIQFDVFWDTEPQYDGAALQYSIDKGSTWQTVGTYGDNSCGDANWYNYQNINYLSGGSPGWSGSVQSPQGGSCGQGDGSGKWLTAKHTLSDLAGQANVIFRFMFGVGTRCNDYDGFAIDNVLINDQPLLLSINTQIKNVTCNGGSDGSINVNVSGGQSPYTYSWNPSVSNSSVATNLSAKSYTINVSDNNNCQSAATAIVTQPAAIDASIIATGTSCKLDDGAATANVSGGVAPYNYTWSIIQSPDTVVVNNTGNTNHINTLKPGGYIAEIKDANSCSVNSSVFTIGEQPPLKISLGADTIICPDAHFIISPGNFQTYLWQDNSTASTFTVTSPGTYSVTVTDKNNCEASTSIVVADGDCTGVYFPSAFSPNGDGLNDKFGIAGTIGPITDYHLLIYNRWGQVVFESHTPSEKWDGMIKGFVAGNETFVWMATFTVDHQKKLLKGTVITIQ